MLVVQTTFSVSIAGGTKSFDIGALTEHLMSRYGAQDIHVSAEVQAAGVSSESVVVHAG